MHSNWFGLLTILTVSTLLAAAPAQSASVRDEALVHLDQLEERFVSLAEEMPAEKYTWRPGEGVRSVSEAFLHAAGSSYFFGGMIGTETPEGVDARGLEKSTTDKAAVIAEIKKAFAHIRGAVESLAGEDLGKSANLFGRESTYEGVLLVLIRHYGEHLGQCIAYARVNGVVPPWSQ